MSLFDPFGARDIQWAVLLSQIPSLVVDLFLIVLAGLAYRQHYRRPREVRYFLAAIVLTLIPVGVPWGIVRNIAASLDPMGTRSLQEQAAFAVMLVNTLISLGITSLIWWCFLKAAFGARPVISEQHGKVP